MAGHGSNTQDYTGEEGDGMDETIVPVDHETAGHLTDDDILQRVSGRGLKSEGATAHLRRSYGGATAQPPCVLSGDS